MKTLALLLVLAAGLTRAAFAQTAVLTADQSELSPGGGTVVLTAVAAYDSEPGALGWAIALPAGWSLVNVSGSNVPAIIPEPGATGTLEFAFTTVPAQRAEFTITVRYPANASNPVATPTVFVRRAGKLTTLAPTPVQWRTPEATPRKSRD